MNVKIHKPSSFLRFSLSQMHTHVYQLCKYSDSIVIPCQILHSNKRSNCMFISLTVESLFTNDPVKETIDILIQYI